MALREINAEPPLNYNVDKNVKFHAGCALAFNVVDGTTVDDKSKVVPADRAALGTGATAWVGFAADDHYTTDNTMIYPDPVGASFISTTSPSTFLGEANGWYVGPRRVLGDFQDETIVNTNNLTDYPASPKRGVGVFVKPGGQFITDQFVEVGTASTTADDVVESLFDVGDLLTFGAGDNAGKLVKLTDSAYGIAVARVDRVDNSGTDGALLYFVSLQA